MCLKLRRAALAVSVLLAVLFCVSSAGAAEFRAFWIDAWGAGVLSQAQVDTLLGVPGTSTTGQIRDANCNAVVVQVRRNCDANYPSSMGEPYMSGLSPADFNSLQAVIDAAHDTTGGKKRIEVHAWMVSFRTSGGLVYTQHSDTPTGSLTTLDNYWITRTDGGTEPSTYALDPGHPLAEDYTVNVAMDIVSNFDVDGLQFDYIRFAANNEGYNPTSIARYNQRFGLSGQPLPATEQFKQWRRDQVSAVVRKTYAKIQAVKPHVKLSVAGVTWNPSPTASTRTAFQSTRPYYDVYSDWDSWLQEGIVDAAMPMTYYDLAGSYTADWTRWINFLKDRHGNRHMYIGPGNYLNSLSNSITTLQQTRTASPAGNYAQGFSGYSYRVPYVSGTWAGFSPSLKSSVTPTWDDIPAMPWKTSPTKGHISGTVTVGCPGVWSDGIYGTTVSISGPESRSMRCDGTGFYAFIDLAPGTYTVTASRTGYTSVSETVVVQVGSVTGNMYVTDLAIAGCPPPVISNVQTVNITTTSATISWTTDQASSSQVQYGLTTSYGSTTTLDPALVTSHSQTLSGLTPGTLYHYRVISTSANGSATSSDYTFATAGPPAISNVAASSITNSAATISWTTNVAASSQVEYGLTTGYGSTTTLDPALVTSHSQALSGLAPNTLYHYRVISTNANGTSTSGDYTFTTSGPPTVSNVQATSITATSATITWITNAPADSTVDYGLTTAYGSQASGVSLVTSHGITLTGLAANTTYHYRCSSSNECGTGVSGDFTFTTTSGLAITEVAVSGITATSATISWTTDQAADSTLNYGTTSALGSQATDASLVTSHSITLTGLSPCTTYHYQCESGNASSSGVSGDYVFVTSPAPTEIILDDGDAGTTPSGTWTTVPGSGYNSDYRYAVNRRTSANATYTWTPTITTPGYYAVYCIYPQDPDPTTKATFTVNYDGGSTSKSFNQSQNTNTWNLIASSVPFAAGTGGTVVLNNLTGESNGSTRVVADAVKLVYMGTSPPPSDIIVDDLDAGAVFTGTWTEGSYAGGYDTYYKFASNVASGATHTATWTPVIPATGLYDVYCWYNSGANRTTAAKYVINYSGGAAFATVNQTAGGAAWTLIGSGLRFDAGTNGSVVLNNATGETAGTTVVVADAIRWVYVGPAGCETTPPTTPTALGATAVSTSSIQLSWSPSTDAVGVTEYKVYRDGVHVGWAASTGFVDTAGLTPNTVYEYQISACDAAGNESVLSTIVSRATLSVPPSASTVTSIRSADAWYNTNGYGFTAAGGFGPGTVAKYRYVFDANAAYTWETGTEADWNSGTLSADAPQDGSYYLHVQGFNSDGIANGDLHLGPFQYDATPPSAALPQSASASAGGIAVNYGSGSDALSGLAGLPYQVTGSNGYDSGLVSAPYVTDTSAIAPGSVVTYTITTWDAAGNQSSQTVTACKPPVDTGNLLVLTTGRQASSLAPPGLYPGSGKVFASSDSFLYGFDTNTPGQLWAPVATNGSVQGRMPVATLNGVLTVLAGSQDGNLYARNAATGEPLWTHDFGAALAVKVTGKPAGALNRTIGGYTGDVVFAATDNNDAANFVRAIRATDGSELWTYAPGNLGAIAGAPALKLSGTGGVLYVASQTYEANTGRVAAVDIATGQQLWQTPIGSVKSSAGLKSDSARVYAVTETGLLYSLDAVTGEVESGYPLNAGSRIYGAPYHVPAANGLLLSLAEGDPPYADGGLKLVSLTGPSVTWTTPVASPSAPVEFRGRVYAGSSDGKLYQLNLADGAITGSRTIGFTVGDPVIDVIKNVIFAGASDGRIYSFSLPF